jgi:hypothetical protein
VYTGFKSYEALTDGRPHRTDSEAKERSKAKKAGSKVEAGKKAAVKGGAAPRAQKKTGNRGAL